MKQTQKQSHYLLFITKCGTQHDKIVCPFSSDKVRPKINAAEAIFIVDSFLERMSEQESEIETKTLHHNSNMLSMEFECKQFLFYDYSKGKTERK